LNCCCLEMLLSRPWTVTVQTLDYYCPTVTVLNYYYLDLGLLLSNYYCLDVGLLLSNHDYFELLLSAEVTFRPLLIFLTISRVLGLRFKWGWTLDYYIQPVTVLNCYYLDLELLLSNCYCLDLGLLLSAKVAFRPLLIFLTISGVLGLRFKRG
jgi:hypothetical protein